MKKVFLLLTMFLFAFTGVTRANVQQNRDDQVIEQGFENGLGDWTTNHCHSSSGVTSSYGGNTGNYAFRFYYTTNYPQYLISPELDDNDGVNFTFYAARYSSNYPETFKVGYSSTTNDPTEFTWGSEVTCTTMYGAGAYQEYSYDFPAGTKYVAIACTSNDQFYMFVDDITVTATEPAPTPGGALTTTPDVLDLGYRPNGAWMAPYVFTINGSGTTVNALDFSGNYFTYNAELPATLTAAHPLEVELTTGEAEEGAVNSTMTVLFSGNRDAQQFNVTANAYNPVNGDVYEKATVVSSFPYNATAPASIYKNYALPTETEGADAVYKMTFANDVLLTAGTTGADGVAALYTEDFNGEGGPMADNNYEYNGPTINPGPLSMWFSYSYTGSNTFFGTSAGGGMIFGYRITPEMLQELGLGNCAITTVEAAAREGSYYDLMLLKGGDTPDVNNMVYYQSFEDYTPLYFFDLNLDEPQFLGDDENIWVMFYTDSPYAAYCGKQPVDINNGKLWYTTNLTSWYSNTTYTPVIYTRFLELPTGREVTVNLADMTIRESKPAAGQIAEAEGLAMGTPKAQLKQNNNRVVVENDNIEDLYVKAGTYYLVAASTDTEFPVAIETAEVPAPEQAVILYPYDGETNVEAPYLAEWVLGDYTEEMQVLVGTQYPPQTALIDWTDYLVESAFIMDLEPNQSYFMQVNERNSAGTTMGEIIAFTTPIDAVEGFAVADAELYPGDAAMFSWTANARTLKGYNLYQDGVKVNEAPITENSYAVEGLEYNMNGYDFQVSAVYDAGESALSDAITVYMTGFGSVTGHAYDLDVEHPIAGATIIAIGVDEYENIQEFEFTTDETGMYEGEILAGLYAVGIVTEGYENEAVVAFIEYNALTEAEDIITHEFYYPLGQITATEEEDDVLVEWSWDPAEMIVDFETGDFSQAEFTLPAQYPWAITTVNPYEGTYCMKSTCEGQASASSIIEATVEVPFEEAKMGFWVRTSSEANYDKFHFYIDGVEKGQALSGQNPYAYKEYSVEAGVHTYKWEYTKDSSVNSNDDCIYVDNICMYRKDEPIPPTPGATTYTFDNSTMEGWTTIDANNDGYDWVLGSEIGGVYLASGASLAGSGHDESADMVCSGSYSNATSSAITPDNYLVAPAQINVQAGASISFFACAQDASYAAEHFGVAVSTTTATASAFTMVQEWTMTAKNSDGAETNSAIRGTREQGSWYNYNVDLSSYAGQTIWVAIRHFNCNDQFILNVDDITVYDGSAKTAPRGDRSFVSYNLYRRNNVDAASVADPELIAEGIDGETYEYVDNDWTTLPYGEWQWGIAATYDGYAPVPNRNRETATFGFEGGLEGWTGIVVNTDGGEWIHSDDNLGGYDYTELAHTGTGFAMCYSYVDYVGAYDTDAYLVSPQKYSVDANSSISFWADNANDDYPESFSVCVSTAANPTASDFTQVWSGGAKGTGNGGAAVRRSDNRYENWRSHEISLAAYAGQEIWIAFHDVNYDEYEIWIDDVTITYAGSAPVPPTPGPTGDGISEILWSNMIEKDMEATLTFEVNLNNGQSAEGAAITIVGANNEYAGTADEQGLAEIVVRKGDTYDITVALEGYTAWHPTGNPIFVEDDINYELLLNEVIAPAEDFYVSPTGWAMWTGATGGVTPTPPTPPTGILFEDDFEDGALTNWSTVDADGDGDTWQNATPAAYSIGDAHSGTNCASSWSWNNVAMYPDNWMISPMVEGATSIQYYVATNTAYPDHYGVYASSTGTSTSNFTLVFEETAGSKGGNGVKSSMTQGSSREMSAWIEKNIELPAGTKYVAFRHWNSDDMNYLFIDDVTIEGAGRGDRAPLSYKMMLDGEYVGETYYPFYQFDVEGMEEGETHIGGVAPLYASGMGDWTYYTWTYKPCENFNDVTEFTSTVNENTVTLNWTLPGAPVPPGPGGNSFTEDFENGLNWNVLTILADGGSWIHSDDNLGGYDYTTHAHSGTGFAMCYSFVDYVGSFDTDSYMYTTEKYSIVNGSTLHFWADNANDSYPENFSVVLSTVDNPTSAADFTQVWSGGAKGTGNGGAAVRHDATRYDNWREHTIDLSAYAGQTAYIGFHDVNYDMYEIWIDDVELSAPAKRDNRDMWDLVYQFDATSGYQYGVATDGENIYTSSWSSSSTSMFYKYDMEGNFIEEFNISGCGQLRGMTYDGEYFYGVANSSTIYCVDLANHTLVGQTNSAYGAMRGITYDPVRDGFWVIGNWSGNLTLVDRTGAIVTTGATPTSASDLAYYADPDGVEHVYCLNNGTNDVDDYNIATNTITSAVFNFNANPLVTGSTGGCFVGAYDGKTCLFGDIQQSPQHIAIYELDAEGPTPPPTPVEGVLGAILYRDGEMIEVFDYNTTTFTEELESGTYEYTIRVIYDGEPDVTYYAMSCGETEEVTITIGVNETEEVVNSIYPNPTSGELYINAEAMKQVTVYNAMGQMVLDQEVSGDNMVLNMGQFESGVYMVKVTTETGSSVKRINVVK